MAEQVQMLQSKIEDESKVLQTLQREMQKYVEGRQKLIEQSHENEMVKKELDLLEPEAKVYKLIASVLVSQTLQESKENVSKRLDFIGKEFKKVEDLIKENTNKQIAKKTSIQKMQEQLYQIVQAYQQSLNK
ncbi:unnamed protein product (macronuclear) [Paramecium tetraurelia]|uniref:Chromosome undetermined scaffold_106, whole genome shotgun sequence n=1 Tax=Paramecium tetraurelia TaxID=5888 RepID=A0BGJ6_PARTE|nr:uncharacterized protein GSPATT00028698001 [Paramecium tetraurelia]XP_001461973.1 uncharacterized protein GSPATT00026924001 [Paramecium tetraurelia]CAK57663.1 unnamed protein product [Paramecium tetraurelia]CAK94600.1 unnamed protein product [Paramecium tetraurelia]|eukprot:XP_001425061.1 hypothetical protein (macronuclear) [Paramecium tetraurelia strain d4-2]